MDCWVYIFLVEGEGSACSLPTTAPFQGYPCIPTRSCEEVNKAQGGTSARILANKQPLFLFYFTWNLSFFHWTIYLLPATLFRYQGVEQVSNAGGWEWWLLPICVYLHLNKLK
jgi:hypothetical protein